MEKYIVVIGLEMHCEIKSNSKVFSSAKNSYSEMPNKNIMPLDMAFPGTLPVVNKKSVEDAIKMALILNCKIPEYLYFDRKNYYYPDLPKGYQITQCTEPIGTNGFIEIESDNKLLKVDIHDIHLEEDSASLDHYETTSCIDYNRSGVPLLELVTEPCLHSASDAVAFLEHMKMVYRYTGISEADTKKGQIRCDVNVSIMEPSAKELGTRVEVKNVNGFGNVFDAINYEIKRQTELMEAGKSNKIEQETRRFDEETGTTIRMRSKVDAIDYKYFIDPNIPKYNITKDWIEKIKSTIPVLADTRKNNYIKNYNLSEYDAVILIKEKEIADYFEKCINLKIEAKIAANWIIGQIMGYLNKNNLSINDIYLTPSRLSTLINLINNGTISNKQAKDIFYKVLEEKKEIETFIDKENKQNSNEDELLTIIKDIINKNTNQVSEYKSGKTNLFDFFVGQVMKETKGKANPVLTKEILSKELNNK
ncbi:MAG: Asp-tRNA(Asn)/Glu-tRNA(Gln) amidotransferase subunit GatB [Bacilli bacterium]